MSKKPAGESPPDIPWGYGATRITALAVDPERLYAYWEITDPDLERARATLPQGGEAHLVLRVFDVTGRIFDGANAHHYFDVPIQRNDRQWFLNVNRPSSRAILEIGLVGGQGSYAALARSIAVDFPRREPASPSEPEWRIAREVSEPSEGTGVRLDPPSQMPASGAPATQGTARAENRAGLSSEERLGAERRAGGGSEERLRDGDTKKNGPARES